MSNDILLTLTVSTVFTCLFYLVWNFYKSRKTTYFCSFSYKNTDNCNKNKYLKLEIPDIDIQKGDFQRIITDIIQTKYPHEKIHDIQILTLNKL